MRLIIRNNLRIQGEDSELKEYLKSLLTMVNPDWVDAQTFGRWTGNIPKHIKQFEEEKDSGDLIIPRGQLEHLLSDLGREWKIVDERAAPRAEKTWPEGNIILRPDDQEPAVQELMSYENGFLSAPAGSGKALSVSTQIPTPAGWKSLEDLSVGDLVLGSDGRPIEVLGVSPVQRRNNYELTFDTGQTIIACEDHLWETQTSHERDTRNSLKGKVRTTKEIIETLTLSQGRTNHSIEVAAPLRLPERELPVPPYTLGAWLGDGTKRCPQITLVDPEILEEIRKDGFVIRKLKEKYGWSIHKAGTETRKGTNGKFFAHSDNLHTVLKSQGLLSNKHIPTSYKRSSKGQRLSLIQGLMDTDGTISKTGKCEFSVTEETLAQGFVEVIRSLGIKCRVTVGDAKLCGRKTSDRFRVVFTTNMPVFRLPRKKKRLPRTVRPTQKRHYIVKARKVESCALRCITVASSDSLYLASESFIPTHNTVMGLEVCRRLGLKALWLTHRDNLIKQVVKETVNLLEIPEEDIGVLRGKKWRVGEQLTIGMIPTLIRRDLSSLLEEFGVIIIDEGHHVPSNTFLSIVNEFPAKYIYALTATAYRNDNREAVMFNCVGPVVSEIEHVELFEEEHLIKPTIRRRRTGWCPVEHSSMEYKDFMAEMVHDKRRNLLIVEDIVSECIPGNSCIVLVDRTKHAEVLTTLLKDRGVQADICVSSLDVDEIPGKRKKRKRKKAVPEKERDRIVEAFLSGQLQVLLTTYQMLKEGFNHRPLNRLFMASPVKYRGSVVQALGRVQRPLEGKEDAIAYDYVDDMIGMFARQADLRLFGVYRRMDMPVVEG